MEDILLVHRKTNGKFSESLQDASVWKTCLRKILFCRESEFMHFAEAIENDDVIFRGEKALSFLLEILCGLHSPIVGETEVFGQFKSFVDERRQIGDTLFSEQQKWLQFVLAEVKKTRSEHLVGIGSQSYGSLLRRHTKDMESVTICGSGQLALEILPWLTHKKTVQILCREPSKLEAIAAKYNNLIISKYSEAYVHGEALVVAAPLEDAKILELMSRQETRPQFVFDLRGEQNQLSQLVTSQFPHVTAKDLQQFFNEIEETKKETQVKIQEVKTLLLERALAFTQRTELRPLGWDDLCA